MANTYEEELGAVGQRADKQINDLIHEVETLTQELDEMDAELGTINDKVVELMDHIEELEHRIAELEGELGDEYVSRFGCSFGSPVPGGVSPLVGRAYLGDGDKPMRWDSKGSLKDIVNSSSEVVWVSAKDAPDTFLRSLLASFGETGKEVIFTQNHEFGNDGPNNSYPTSAQIQEYMRRWRFVVDVAKEFDYVKTACILLGSQNVSEWEPLVPEGIDLMGFDRYNPGIQKAKRYAPVEEVFGPVADFADSHDLPLAIGETGTNIVNGNVAGRARWAGEAKAYLISRDVYVACWWNSKLCTLDSATAAVWLD